LWQDERGRYVFVPGKRSLPRRQITVEAEFGAGEVLGEFGCHARLDVPSYPLQHIDAMIYANWLAGTGDLFLHAAGVEVGGRGICFAGHPGAGKSTLVNSLISDPRRAALAAATSDVADSAPVVVLGEDNVVLRYLEGRFWIYGTPWHLDPARCDPRGVPLDKLYFLDRTLDPGVAPVGPLEGVARLMQTAFVPYYRPAAVSGILARLELLSERVPFYTLSYRLGSDVLATIDGG
jgi:hypothetical protein